MPTDYQCASCELAITTGSFHGMEGDYITAVYCKQCGTQYYVHQSSMQFFDEFEKESQNDGVCQYTVRGPLKIQTIDVEPNGAISMVMCDVCFEKGVFGNAGLFIGVALEGLGDRCFTFDSPGLKPNGKCPGCKKQTMVVAGEWTT